MNNKDINSKPTKVYLKIKSFDVGMHNRIISALKKLSLPKEWLINEEILVDDEDLYSIIWVKDQSNEQYFSDIDERDDRLKRATKLLDKFDKNIISEIKELDPIIFLGITTKQEFLPLNLDLMNMCARTGVEIYLYFFKAEE